MTEDIRYLPIPLDIGNASIPVGMSEEDFQLLLETLKLWKKKIVRDDFTTYHGKPPTEEELGDERNHRASKRYSRNSRMRFVVGSIGQSRREV
jgi:hypothetical protein